MAESAPDWSNTIRLCLSESDEEVFECGSSNRRSFHSTRPPDDNNWRKTSQRSQEFQHPADFESCAVHRSRQYVRRFSESVSSSMEYLRRSEFTPESDENTLRSNLFSGVESESFRERSLTEYGSGDSTEPAPARASHVHTLERQRSIVDGLLLEIYDRSHRQRADSLDSDTVTECSSVSEAPFGRGDGHYHPYGTSHPSAKRYNRHLLQSYNVTELQSLVQELQRNVTQVSLRLVRHLKRRDRRLARMSRHCDVITAVLQAASLKRQIDTRMKFSLAPPPGPSAFEQWKDAMKAVNRLPLGIPAHFRKKVWLSLADRYIRQLKVDWNNTLRLAFNDRSNPDDDKLGMQIVKDLHRTGCSSFSGQDNEEDRAVLKRVLLAYARWNKRIGYCQGFNVIVALLLNVMEKKEDDALKVMIYLVDHVLPESYFDNNLRALSVDMAVFRDLLKLTLPSLYAHLDHLQHAAQDSSTGASYEPPLTNVFTMQWFLTLFATCLPKDVVLRIWDAVFLEGSEVLLRTALCLWAKLARRIMMVESADEFYSLMGEMSSDMMEGVIFDSDKMIKAIYAVAPFPFPQLTELREKYTYNIRPFSNAPAPSRKPSGLAKAVLYSDEEEPDEEELRALAALPGMTTGLARGKNTDISVVGPGVFGGEREVVTGAGRDTVYMERMSTDITALKMQYNKLRLRQRQAHVIIAAVTAKKAMEVKQKSQAPVLLPSMQTMNHLFVSRVQGRNRVETKAPDFMADFMPAIKRAPTKQVHAQTAAAAAAADDVTAWATHPATNPAISPVTSPTTASPPSVGSCSTSSSPERGGGTTGMTRKTLLECLEEPAQFCSLDADVWSESSPQPDSSDDSNSRGVCGSAEAGRPVSAVCRPDHCDEREKPGHLPSLCEDRLSEDSECSSLYSQQGEETPLPQSSVCSEDRRDSTESEDHYHHHHHHHNQQTQLDGKGEEHSSHSRKGESHSQNQPAVSPLQDGCLRCAKCQLRDVQSSVIMHSLKNDVQSRCNHTAVCAESTAKTASGADKVIREEEGGQKPSHISISRSHSLPTPSLPSPTSLLSPAPSPKQAVKMPPGVKARHLSSPCTISPASSRCLRPFQPFQVKQMTSNRARTGLKLGLYTPSSLEHIQGQLLGGLAMKKASHEASS